jgi:hypothetical protein
VRRVTEKEEECWSANKNLLTNKNGTFVSHLQQSLLKALEDLNAGPIEINHE